MANRYYFRLLVDLDFLSLHFLKAKPNQKQLAALARKGKFPFNEKSVVPALEHGQSFGDGLMYALAAWYGTTVERLIELKFVRMPTEPPQHLESRGTDYLLLGTEFLANLFINTHRLQKEALIQPERADAVRKAADVTLACVGAENGDFPTNAEVSEKELWQKGIDQGIAESREAFHAQLESFWRKNPMTVLNAVTSSKNKVGVASVLPVTDGAYDDVRAGRRSLWTLSGDDVLLKSNRQIIYVVAHRVDRKNKTPPDEVTKCLASTLFIAVALGALPVEMDSLHLLAIGGTPLNCERLVQNGYTKLNIPEARSGNPLYEMRKGNFPFAVGVECLKSIQRANR